MPRVRLLNDPVLRQAARPVTAEDMSLMPALVDTMIQVMKAERGIGLAANQIGEPYAMFVLSINGVDQEFINPVILSQNNPISYDEGCLSIPGASAKTTRFNELTLRYSRLSDMASNCRHETAFHGLEAIAIQHEMDHLNGKLYIDQFGPVKRGMVLDKHKKHMKELNRRR